MSQSFGEIFQTNAGYVDDLYARYQNDPRSVSVEWRHWFQGFQEGLTTVLKSWESLGGVPAAVSSAGAGGLPAPGDSAGGGQGSGGAAQVFVALQQLVHAFASQGHRWAWVNPLADGAPARPQHSADNCLDPAFYGLTPDHLRWPLPPDVVPVLSAAVGALPQKPPTVGSFIESLNLIYCGSVGIECCFLNPNERLWVESQLPRLTTPAPAPVQYQIAQELARADVLEKTIGTKFIGKKRFSIEGADAQIPALESLFEAAAGAGAREFTLGMAHRGRLNILVHVVHKPLEQLVAEFEGEPNPNLGGDGDVKYHNGYECERQTRGGTPVRVSLAFNPSHLEFVDSVVLGEARAKQDLFYGSERKAVVPVLLHGDAAIAGQGTVYETINMMNLPGFTVGGTIHIVANNQVGFTTNPVDSRSSLSCTDVAKVVGAPVFHVNSTDLDAVHQVMTLAADYRQRFGKDVFVDLVCFRRHGHNEGDEPMFTQPLMYKKIKSMPTPFDNYVQKLSASGAKDSSDSTAAVAALKDYYQQVRTDYTAQFDDAKKRRVAISFAPWGRGFEKLQRGSEAQILDKVDTAVPEDVLKKLASELIALPAGFKPHQKLSRIVVQERQEMAQGLKPLDWGFAELLAYASLVAQGHSVRLVGQDARRGTFAHRHVALVDEDTGLRHVALEGMGTKGGARFEVVDSLLSESAVMGFEYGFASTHPEALVIWEGQFGDFVNGAQVIVDQFVISGETKWGRTQGLTLLLPHGYEGQGPEHSSGRLERFLQLAAQGNMQVCNVTSAAQIFHVLRRQVVRSFRKPLIIMSPKSFLRNPRTTVGFAALSAGGFATVIDDPRFTVSAGEQAPVADAGKVKKVVLCTGKFAIDLLDLAEKEDPLAAIAIVRVEQIAPLDAGTLAAVVQRYPQARLVWAQEEPANMGAAGYVQPRLQRLFKAPEGYVGRSERASPSVGVEKQHLKEQAQLVKACFDEKQGDFLV